MMTVPYQLGASSIHGIGVFAIAPIEKDTVVWRFIREIDRMWDEADIKILPVEASSFLSIYGHRDDFYPGKIILCCGDGRFVNHSETPNLYEKDGCSFAARAIRVGEELTADYRTYSAWDAAKIGDMK